MPAELIVPATIMSLAFVFYTTGVFAERAARDLRGWHLAMFWLGLVCDSTATELMRQMRISGVESGIIHTVTGVSALALMAGHAVWAWWIYRRGSVQAKAGFHRYSVLVWAVWLVPYLGGMIAGMAKGF